VRRGDVNDATRGSDRSRAGNRADQLAYWLSIGAIFLLQGALWCYPFKSKVFDEDLIAPDPIKEQFAGSFISDFPGTSVAWGILGILQGLIFVGLVASLISGEFLPTRRKPILLAALALSLAVLALMLFGNSMTSQFDSVASLFTYFVLTAGLMVFVLLLPPYRRERWLSALAP
jgi:hypothetical protein